MNDTERLDILKKRLGELEKQIQAQSKIIEESLINEISQTINLSMQKVT